MERSVRPFAVCFWRIREVGPGRGNRPRLVRLEDGTLVTVFSGGRGGGVQVREVKPRRERGRPSRDRR
jgi:hypothetical protein